MQSATNAKTRLINGLSGAIGGILCYAIAAKLARPKAAVIAGMGDGTVGFHLAEFETAAREQANIVAIVCNDALWNAEHQIQIRDYGEDRTYGCGILPTARYDEAAAALGCHGARVDDATALDAAIAEARGSGKPACLDVTIASLPAPVYTPFE
jgi:acetolactate synthase-1/2/3 large subunit